MQFKTMIQVKKASNQIIKEFEEGTSKRIHFPVLFKKALIEFSIKTETSFTDIAKATDIKLQNINRWSEQYEAGLYQMDGTYAVSKISKSINGNILKALKQQLVEITDKIKLIEQCEALGLKVSG